MPTFAPYTVVFDRFFVASLEPMARVEAEEARAEARAEAEEARAQARAEARTEAEKANASKQAS